MKRHFLAALGFGALALAAHQTHAEGASKCAPRPTVLKRLADGYGETRQSIGLGGSSQVIEVFAAAETGSWTIIVTRPDGISCIVAAGMSFENLSEELPARGAPA